MIHLLTKKKSGVLLMISAYLIIKKESTRVPNKNFRILGNKPLYLHIIEKLLKNEHINEILINTDAIECMPELKELKKVKIIQRPDRLNGNSVCANRLLFSDIDKFKNQTILMTHTTNPFVKISTFSDAINKFNRTPENDSLIGVTTLKKRTFLESGEPINHNPRELIPTQDLAPIFIENSCIYIFTKTSYKKNNNRIGETPLFFRMCPTESLDIDTQEDWELAELQFTRQKE